MNLQSPSELKQGTLSVVVPAYNEELSVPAAAKAITGQLREANIEHEIIFVDDGSKDKTWNAIQDACKIFPEVRGVKFSRNFGKEAAIFAGLAQGKGDCCVVIDCDLQHPPEKIVEAALAEDIRLVGLSALMTTTLPAMKKTIEALRAAGADCKIMVGGAVLTPEYAREIGADYYARDAKRSADIAAEVFGG